MSKLASIGSIVGSLLNILIRLLFSSLSYLTLWISLGFSVCLVGKYTFKIIQSKREGNFNLIKKMGGGERGI
uniref:Uncharacterized protein n=1 Tax=Meloidogyne enterolobii TaxID=390850 RepID=A0A6V7U9S0_MELEN|nr:unnamed protein product [Meloidogyne enterolobii]